VIWYFDLFNVTTNTGLPAIKKVTYQSKDQNYSVSYTNNWEKLSNEELSKKGVKFDTAFVNKKDNEVIIGINKPMDKDMDYGKDMEGSLEILLDGIKKDYEEKSFKLISSNTGEENGLPYLEIEFSVDNIKQKQRIYITSDKLYIIVASAYEDKFDEYQKDIDQFFQSYKLSQ